MSRPSTWQRRVLRGVFIYGVVPYVSVVLIFTTFQRRLMYRPTPSTNLSVAELKLDPDMFRDVELQTSDNETLRGWLLTGQRSESEAPESTKVQLMCICGLRPGLRLQRSHG